MRILLLALVGALAIAYSVPQKAKKALDAEVVESKVRRADGKILVDGSVRVTGEKTLRGLLVVLDLMSAENTVVGSEKAVLDEEPLQPGEERTYHAATSDLFRAVKYRLRGFDMSERELRLGNAGPFPIE